MDLGSAFLWYQAHLPLVGGLAASGIVGLKALRLRGTRQHARQHGEARWATVAALRQAGLLRPHGVILGRYRRRLLRFPGPGHMLVVASTQSGKSTSIVI